MAYDIGDKGQLTGDDLLAELHRAGFQVRRAAESMYSWVAGRGVGYGPH